MAIVENDGRCKWGQTAQEADTPPTCGFCNDYLIFNEIEIENAEQLKPKEYKQLYSVSLVRTHIVNGEKRGTLTYNGYPLRFCPSCGKKLV